MAFLVSHALHADAGASGGYRAEGWSPAVSVMLGGPTPAGASVVLVVERPDGSPWFSSRAAVPELAVDGWTRVELRRGSGGADGSDDLREPGAVRLTLRLVSELDGVDELLHEGIVTAVALDGEQRYALAPGAALSRSLLCLDAVDEPDAPRLRVTVSFGGYVDGSRLEAHCFRDGVRFAAASGVQTDAVSTANDGSVAVTEATATFDTVRGWNNLQASGWGAGWELLDAADAEYEVKVLCDSRVVRIVAFSVAGGRIVAQGGTGSLDVEADPWMGWVMLGEAQIVGEETAAVGSLAADAESGGRTGLLDGVPTGSRVAGMEEVYALRAADGGSGTPGEGAGGGAAGTPGEAGGGAASMADAGVDAVAVQAFVDRAERLLVTWEADLVGVVPPFDLGQVLTAEAVDREAPGYGELREAVASVPDDHAVRMSGEPRTMGELRVRVAALLDAARARIASAAQADDDALAPFRAVLTGDKLEVFEEHPADAFQYATTGRRSIETPDELAAAEYWYFEGPLDLLGTATVDGVQVKVSAQGWRVVGYQFDGDGMLVDQFENQGQGSSAPLSAYRPHP